MYTFVVPSPWSCIDIIVKDCFPAAGVSFVKLHVLQPQCMLMLSEFREKCTSSCTLREWRKYMAKNNINNERQFTPLYVF